MSNKLRQLIVASLESAEVQIMNPVTDQQETNIDEVLLEVAESSTEVQEADRAVEVFTETEDQVQGLADNLEEQISTESLTPAVIKTHNIAMANALSPLREYYDVSRVTVSHESFGADMDSQTASLEALEGAKKALKDIAAAIISAVRSAYEAAKNFFINMGKSGQALINGAAKLTEAAKNSPTTGGHSGKKIKAGSAAKYLAQDGKLDITTAVRSLNEINKVLLTIGANTEAAAGVLLEHGIKASEGSFDNGAFGMALSNASFKGLPSKLPGGYSIKQVVGAAPSIEFVAGEGADIDEIELSDTNQASALAASVRNLGKTMAEFNAKHFKKLENNTSKLLSDLQKEAVKAEKDKEAGAALKANLSKVSKMAHFAKSVSQKYLSYAGNAGKAALSLGFAAIKATSAKAE